MSIHVETISPPDGLSFRLLRWRDNVKDVEEYDAAGRPRPVQGAGERWHLHREMELTFIERGNGLRLVGDDIAGFTGPELVLLGPHLPHCWHGLRRSAGFSVQFHWPVDHPIRALPEFSGLAQLWPKAGRGLLFEPELARKLQPQFEQMAETRAAGRLGALLGIFGELAAAADRQMRELSSRDFGAGDDARHQQGIERVIRHALERYAEPFQAEEILRLAGMSKATFARQFSRYTGSTYTDFLNRVRLDHARQRILVANEPVSVAAFAVGFNHLSHFNRVYRRVFGVTPTADRARRGAA